MVERKCKKIQEYWKMLSEIDIEKADICTLNKKNQRNVQKRDVRLVGFCAYRLVKQGGIEAKTIKITTSDKINSEEFFSRK